MEKLFFLIAGLICFFPLLGTAQITDYEPHIYEGSSGDTLRYRFLKPQPYDSSKSYPLLLFLHGAGERGDDNFSQLKWGASHFAAPKFRSKYPAFVVAPQVPEDEYWSTLRAVRDTNIYSQPMAEKPSSPMQLTIDLLEKLQEEFSIDSRRLYVTGLSMGGFGTFDLIQRYPNKFAAAVPICGGGDMTRAFLLKDMPIWVFHGTKDGIVAPEFSRNMVGAIQAAGGSPGFTEYPEAGHIEAWVQAYDDPLIYEWMFSKRLKDE